MSHVTKQTVLDSLTEFPCYTVEGAQQADRKSVVGPRSRASQSGAH